MGHKTIYNDISVSALLTTSIVKLYIKGLLYMCTIAMGIQLIKTSLLLYMGQTL